MYKLLLVTDQEDVLHAFNQISDWELNGFRQPHIRHDYEGAKDSLQKHHADGIAIALSREEEKKVLALLQDQYPYISILRAGRTPEEVLYYLNELKQLLNRVHADFSDDSFKAVDMLLICRHDFIRKVIAGKVTSREDLYRTMRLLRSRMDPDKPCMLMELEQTAVRDDLLEGRWYSSMERLELALRNSFGGDVDGLHILPIVQNDGKVFVLICPLRGLNDTPNQDDMRRILEERVGEGIRHMWQYKGLTLQILNLRELPALTSLCGDA